MINVYAPAAPATDEQRRQFRRAIDNLKCARLQLKKAEEEFEAAGSDVMRMRSERRAIERLIRAAREERARKKGRKTSRPSRRPYGAAFRTN